MAPSLRVGTKVICVDTLNIERLYNETIPVMNGTYTIREIINDPAGGSAKCVRLREIVNQPAPYKTGVAECSFRASRFAIKHGK